MKAVNARLARAWMRLGPSILPFADAATPELPLGRLLRLSLFQVTVGMAAVLVIGTLNRVMIVELDVPAWIVALMLSLPLLFAPFRALIGFRSDNHRSVLGWRRVPYIWMGTLIQFGGLSIMPFALLILSGDTTGPIVIGQIAAAIAFVMVGTGLHTTQTVGLALATDLAPPAARAKVVALLCAMLLLGMVVSAVVFGLLLADFSAIRLIQVVQGAAVVTMVLNGIALWKQEPRDLSRTDVDVPRPDFFRTWIAFADKGRTRRRLLATGIGTAAFSMQDVLLEPYGGHVLKLSVAHTTALTAMLAAGGGVGLLIAARWLGRGGDPFRVAALGVVVGILAFSAVIFAAPLDSSRVFALGVTLIGLGGGIFAHGTLTAAMMLTRDDESGLALGAWGAVQATAAGLAIATGGILSDTISGLAAQGRLGQALTGPSVGYGAIYFIEIALLFITLIAIGPLVRTGVDQSESSSAGFGLAGLRG